MAASKEPKRAQEAAAEEDDGDSVVQELQMDDAVVKSTVKVRFLSNEHAEMAKTALEVDGELNPNKVVRVFRVEDAHLILEVGAIDFRSLRMSLNSFFDVAGVAVKTLEEFGGSI